MISMLNDFIFVSVLCKCRLMDSGACAGAWDLGLRVVLSTWPEPSLEASALQSSFPSLPGWALGLRFPALWLPGPTQLPPPCTCPRRATLSPSRGLGAGRVGVRVIDLSVSGQSKCPRQGLSGLQCIRWVTQTSRPLTQPSRDLRHFDAEAAVLLGVACLPRGLGQQAVGRVDAWRPAFLLSVMAQCPGLAAGGRGKLVTCGCWVWGPS